MDKLAEHKGDSRARQDRAGQPEISPHHSGQRAVQNLGVIYFRNFPFNIFGPQLTTERKLLQIKARIMGDCTQMTCNFQSYSEILT